MKNYALFFLSIILTLGLIVGLYTLVFRATDDDFSDILDGQPYVLATVFPIYDIARNLAGDDINVQLLLPAGASPHTFELSPVTARHFANADLIFAMGHGIDDWATKNTDPSRVRVVDTSIPLRASIDEEDGPTDPHYWLSGENGKIIAQNIANALKTQYPQYANAVDTHLATYLAELQVAHETTHTIINEVGNKNIVTLHDAWYYFANAYGLTIVDTYTPSAGKDPLPQDLARLQKTIEDYGIQTFYMERQTSSTSLQAFFEDNHLLVGELDELGGLEGTQSYIDLLLYNANVFASQP